MDAYCLGGVPSPVKPIRTILCVPGHDERKVARARDFGADLVLWDLEDSVPADQKVKARALVAAHARPGDAVRMSGGEGWQVKADAPLIEALPGVTPWLPKVCGATTALCFSREVGRPVVAIIETPYAVLTLAEAASFDDGLHPDPPGLAGLAFGRADFMAAVGAKSIDSPLVYRAQEMVALAAHALGVPCYDSPCEERDGRQVAWETRRAIECCYTGKGCIYPLHVALVREMYQPSTEDVARAERIVARAEELGGALFEDCGKVVAPPHVKAARELLSARG